MTAAVIVIAQRKGGAGKTTLAAHLGAAWAVGRDVTLIDTDSQASLSRWHQNREARLGGAATGLRFAAVAGWHAPAEIRRRAGACDILLVDTPASGESEARLLMRCASLVVVPVQPSPIDVWATLPTLDMARRERVPVLLVLNRVPSRAALTAAMRDLLGRYDASLAATSIGNRVAFAAAFAEGWGVTECALGSAAAQEIAALAREVLALLPSSGRARPAHKERAPPSEHPVSLVAKPAVGDAAARAAGTNGDRSNPIDAPEFAALGDVDWALREDQLRAGIASLKRRLARRPR